MMDSSSPSDRREPIAAPPRGMSTAAPRRVAVSLLVLALTANEFSAWTQAHRADATWTAAPVVAVALPPDPQVARPTESLGDCDFVQRSLVTNEVAFRRCHVVATSLIGGLYGP